MENVNCVMTIASVNYNKKIESPSVVPQICFVFLIGFALTVFFVFGGKLICFFFTKKFGLPGYIFAATILVPLIIILCFA